MGSKVHIGPQPSIPRDQPPTPELALGRPRLRDPIGPLIHAPTSFRSCPTFYLVLPLPLHPTPMVLWPPDDLLICPLDLWYHLRKHLENLGVVVTWLRRPWLLGQSGSKESYRTTHTTEDV